jgi:hypothetical protein
MTRERGWRRERRGVWTIEADSHFDAMTKYYSHMGWGEYTSEHVADFDPYPDEWLQVQRASA